MNKNLTVRNRPVVLYLFFPDFAPPLVWFSWLKTISVVHYDGGTKSNRGYVDLKTPETYSEQTLTAQKTNTGYSRRGEETSSGTAVLGVGFSGTYIFGLPGRGISVSVYEKAHSE